MWVKPNSSSCELSISKEFLRVLGLVTLSLLFAPIDGSGSSATPCPLTPAPYTPDQTRIKAQIRKLEVFEKDVRGTLADVKALQTESAVNHFTGKVAEWRTYAGEAGAALCSSIDLVNEKLATPCTTVKSVVDVLNDLHACGKGESTSCIGAGLALTKQHIKNKRQTLKEQRMELGGQEPGAKSDPRYLMNEDLQKINGDIRLNEVAKAGVEKSEKLNNVLKGGIDAVKEACEVTVAAIATAPASTSLTDKTVKTGCSIAGNLSKINETRIVGRELTEAFEENDIRQSKLIQQLEARVGKVSQLLGDLRAQVYNVDWAAMVAPEPNKSIIRKSECDTQDDAKIKPTLAQEGPASEKERREALSQLNQPTSVGLSGDSQEDARSDGLMNQMTMMGSIIGQAMKSHNDNASRSKLKDVRPGTAPLSQSHQLSTPSASDIDRQPNHPCRQTTTTNAKGVSSISFQCGPEATDSSKPRPEAAPSPTWGTMGENIGKGW